MVVTFCESPAQSAKNCVVLNHSTDGVSCEVEWNKQTLLDYLAGITAVVHCLAQITMQNVAAIRQWVDRVLPV